MAKPRCTVVFKRNKYGEVAQLMYKGERLDEESVEPGERKLTAHLLMKRCKESVAARAKPGWNAGQFFRLLDFLRARASARR